MPPLRSLPISKVPAKTERSHEENQERAYIAASRRSDRSLEARVESARRASEIHKRRTGRSLRVTEQDVVNEEMYEEEDDDLPLHYRRLTAHLNTNSPDFNRRLAAYLTNHVAMRTALSQAISSSYGTPQPLAQEPWAQNNNPMQQQWGNFQPQGVPQSPHQNNMSPTTTHASPSSYRQSPYPMPGQDGYRASHNQRSASTVTSPTGTESSESKEQAASTARRRTIASTDSMPQPDGAQRSSSSSSVPRSSTVPAGQDGNTARGAQNNSPFPFQQSEQLDISPLTTSLPPETLMMLGPNFSSFHPFGQPDPNFEKQSNQAQGFNPNVFNKATSQNQTYGMSQTLAPSVLDSSSQQAFRGHGPNSNDANLYAFSSAFDQDSQFSSAFFADEESGQESGTATPGDKEWAQFIDSSSWDEVPSTS